MKSLTVVIPSRTLRPIRTTLDSLQKQTFQDFITIVQPDNEQGANWARNKGFEHVKTEFVLFSDDDIMWRPDAFELMIATLDANPDVSYAYGSYKMGEWIQCDHEFDAAKLRNQNFISTMSIIRSAHFPGFDVDILRLQDWDLWLTMLEQQRIGKYCGSLIFSTEKREGLTYNAKISYEDAVKAVRQKHNL